MDDITRAYTITEVSKIIDVAPGTLRQWEKDFELNIARTNDENKSRYYVDFDIEMLKKIKEMRAKKLSKPLIKDMITENADQIAEMRKIQSNLPDLKRFSEVSDFKNEVVNDIEQRFIEVSNQQVKQQNDFFITEFNKMKQEIKNEMKLELKQEYESRIRELELIIEAKDAAQEKLIEQKEPEKKGFFQRLFGK